jgi:DNA repair protein RecN (Recombination protein N)
VAAAHRAWRAAEDARREAERDLDAMLRERDMLEWQVRELDELQFEPEAWVELNQEHKRLTHAASLQDGVDRALTALSEMDGAAASVVEHEAARLGALTEFDDSLKEAHSLLDAAAISLEEAASSLRRYRDRLDIDPARLLDVESRLEAVIAMARKHRVDPLGLGEVHAALASRLKVVGEAADPAALAEREAKAHSDYMALAKKLSAGRAKTAKVLSEAITASMQELALAGARFEIALDPLAEGGAGGLEAIEFRVAANLKQPLRALSKVASGGELSRIGLAIQVIASQAAHTPTLIFDEVDVGIGGRVAEIVGRLLKQLGAHHQVLCVTHLPQVAAQADWQWSIAKENRGGETVSSVRVLDEAARIEEIARMLGGVKITETTRSHAAELLGVV